MDSDSQSTYQEPAPLSPNKRIENRQPKKNLEQINKLSRKSFLRGVYRNSGKKKENITNPLSFIDKIISDCDHAIHQSSDSNFEFHEDNSCCLMRQESTSIERRYHSRGKHKGRELNKTEIEEQCENLKNKHYVLPKMSNSKRSFNYTGIVPGISNEMLKRLYEAKCVDLQRPISGEQERRFVEFCTKVIQHRKLALKEVKFRNKEVVWVGGREL
jgi:hypothetical protein